MDINVIDHILIINALIKNYCPRRITSVTNEPKARLKCCSPLELKYNNHRKRNGATIDNDKFEEMINPITCLEEITFSKIYTFHDYIKDSRRV